MSRLVSVSILAAVALLASGCAFVETQQLMVGRLQATLETNASLPVEIPFDDSQGHVRVEGVVNDAVRVMVVLDTGAHGITLIQDERLAEAGLDKTTAVKIGSRRPTGLRGDVRMGTDLALGSVVFRDFPAIVAALVNPVCQQRRRDRGIDAIVGRHLFEEFTVEFDWDRKTVVLHDPATYVSPQAASVIPLTLRRGNPYATFAVTEATGGTRSMEFLVDTGQPSGLILNAEHRDISVPDQGPEGRGCRADGIVRYRQGPSVALAVGETKLATVAPDYPLDIDDGFAGKHGAIGLAAFAGYNLIFDYARKRMLLVPRRTV